MSSWNACFAQRTQQMKSSAIRELLKVTEQPGVISFGGGLPSPESFPIERFSEACQTVIRTKGALALQYGTTDGYTPLRELIVERTREMGIMITNENVLITSGSQQALDLIGKVMINPEDRILVEAPTYFGALQAWNAYGAKYTTIASDNNGMITDGLEKALQHRPKFIYVLPNFQNPAGITLSLERRQRLVQLANEYGIPIIEDDPYRQLRFEGEDLPSILQIDSALMGNHALPYDGNVIYMSTFSKILSPGIRLGWIVAPADVIERLVIAKQGTDLHTSSFVQMVAYEIDKDHYLEQHVHHIRELYRQRRDAMLAALDRYFPAETFWTHPAGGLFMWATLPDQLNAEEILLEAVKRNVAFVPGTSFYPDGRGKNQMRLNFSYSSTDVIHEGIARLGELLQDVCQPLSECCMGKG